MDVSIRARLEQNVSKEGEKAEKALRTAPGVLAVKVEYEQQRAIVGTAGDKSVDEAALLEALDSIGYRGKVEDE